MKSLLIKMMQTKILATEKKIESSPDCQPVWCKEKNMLVLTIILVVLALLIAFTMGVFIVLEMVSQNS